MGQLEYVFRTSDFIPTHDVYQHISNKIPNSVLVYCIIESSQNRSRRTIKKNQNNLQKHQQIYFSGWSYKRIG